MDFDENALLIIFSDPKKYEEEEGKILKNEYDHEKNLVHSKNFALSDGKFIWYNLKEDKEYYIVLIDQKLFETEKMMNKGKEIFKNIVEKSTKEFINIRIHETGPKINEDELYLIAKAAKKRLRIPKTFNHKTDKKTVSILRELANKIVEE